MKLRKTLALGLALLLALAALPAGAGADGREGKAAPTQTAQTEFKLIEEERNVNEEALEAIIDFSIRAKEMEERCAPLVKKSGDPVFGEARLIVFGEAEPDMTGALAFERGYPDRWLIQYASPEEAETAFKRLDADERIANVVPDARMQADHDYLEYDFESYGYDYFHADLNTYERWLYNDADGYAYINTIAVIDSGINAAHPIFGSSIAGGYDFVDSDWDPDDEEGHGTHVAGTIMQAGWANFQLLNLRVLDSDGFGATNDIMSAIIYATNYGVSAMNISIGWHTDDPSSDSAWRNAKAQYETYIGQAFDADCIVVVSAGNNGCDASYNIPACIERAFTVGAHSSLFTWYSNSNFGPLVDITASGVRIWAANKDLVPLNVEKTGTSMATPHVTAACALVRSRHRYLDPDAVVCMVKDAAMNIGLVGGGSGALSIANLVRQFCYDTLPQTPTDPAVNSALHFLSGQDPTFYSPGRYPVYAESNGNRVRSGNAGIPNSRSTLTISLYLREGANVRFDYAYETEANYDFFDLHVNGQEVLHLSGSSDGFVDYIVTANRTGTYSFVWSYTKDGSVDSGYDGFKMSYLYWEGEANPHTYNTATPPVGEMAVLNGSANHSRHDMFVTSIGDYPFTDDYTSGRYHIRSSNVGVNNSYSALKLSVILYAGDKLSYSVYVDSEEDYDFFRLYVNDTFRMELSGHQDWTNYVFTATESRLYTFEWRYEKDNSVSVGEDCVRIDDIKLGGGVPGDVNGNGSVDVLDALAVLRYSMGLLANIDMQAADVDGNGAVNVQDALMILRAAMGLITL